MLKSDPSLVIDDVDRSFGVDLLSSGDFGMDSCIVSSCWDSLNKRKIAENGNSIYFPELGWDIFQSGKSLLSCDGL